MKHVFAKASELVHRSAFGALTIVEYNSIPNWCEGEVAMLPEEPFDVAPILIWEQYRAIWFSLVASTLQERFKHTASQRLALASIYAEKANSIDMLWALDCYTISVDIDADIAERLYRASKAENARKERKRIAD